MMLWLLNKLDQSSRATLIVAGLLVLALIGVIDYLTGFELLFSVFYLLEVGLAAWFVGRGFGLIMSVLSVIVWIGGDLAAGAHYSNLVVPVWNAVILMVFYFIVVWLLTRLRSLHKDLESRVTERTQALRHEMAERDISRENGTRLSAISVFIKGRDMGSVVADMQERVSHVPLPQGYLLTWSGEFENQQRAMRRLAIIVPISTFLIFVLLFDAFKSVKSALLVLINVPLGLIGGIFALLLTGIPLSVSAAIGFIALFGQAVLNGVVMVSYFNQLQDQGHTPYDAVLQGAATRLRTVLMTALLATLGLLPMALSHGIGSETQRPLAIVIIGGLVSATFLTLMVLPTLYLVIERRARARMAG